MIVYFNRVKSPTYYKRDTTQYSVRDSKGIVQYVDKIHSYWLNQGVNRPRDYGRRGHIKKRFKSA